MGAFAISTSAALRYQRGSTSFRGRTEAISEVA